MKKIFTKLVLLACIIVMFFSLYTPRVSAIFADFNAVGKMNDVLNDLGVDKNELKYQIQTLNVSRRKKQQPQVQITFDPPNPSPGEKVTASATPIYFLNDYKDLYFTWYLKTQSNKDEDIEQWKEDAMRIYASNGFDWTKANYNNPPDDHDGYEARDFYGGNDQKGKPYHCYAHDIASGDEYEITCHHYFPDDHDHSNHTGDDSFGPDEEEFWHTNPEDPDTAGTGLTDEANVAGLGAAEFSWIYTMGDKIGVVVEGVSPEPTQYSDSSYKTMWAMPSNNSSDCGVSFKDNGYPMTSGTVPITPETHTIAEGTTWAGDTYGDGASITDTTAATHTCPTVTEDLDGDTFEDNNACTLTTTGYYQDVTSISKQVNDYAWIRTKRTYTLAKVLTQTHKTTPPTETTIGSGSISHRHTTCPQSPPSYDVDGNPIYTYTDEIDGITRECTALDEEKNISNEIDGSNIDAGCLESNLIDPQEGGSNKEKMDISLTYSPKYPMNDVSTGGTDGDEVIVNSSITNATNPGYLTYNWSLFASDQANPPSWGNALSNSSLGITQSSGVNLNTLKFKLNNSSLKKYIRVRLDVEEKVTEFASDNGESTVSRKGNAEVVIPVSDNENKIKAYSATVGNEVQPSLTINTTREICNTTKIEKALCSIARNQIIAVQIVDKSGDPANYSNFLWTINGKPVQPIGGGSTSHPYAYFAALDQNGSQYDVTVTANATDGSKINMSRTFLVADPVVAFSTDYDGNGKYDDSVRPILMGYYQDINEKLTEDYSKTNFLGLTASPLRIAPVFSGFTPADSSQIFWTVDGQTFTQKDAIDNGYYEFDGNYIVLPGKPTAESYDITVSSLYAPSINVQRALNTYWGVTYADFYETKSPTTNGKIRMVDFFDDTVISQSPSKKILASIYSGLPAYFAFLLRIVLTGSILLLITRFVFSFSRDRDSQ
jgi:hypothetical protein